MSLSLARQPLPSAVEPETASNVVHLADYRRGGRFRSWLPELLLTDEIGEPGDEFRQPTDLPFPEQMRRVIAAVEARR